MPEVFTNPVSTKTLVSHACTRYMIVHVLTNTQKTMEEHVTKKSGQENAVRLNRWLLG